MRAAFCPQDDKCPDDERQCDRQGLEEIGLDRFLEEQAENGERQKGDEQVERKALGGAFARQAGKHLGDFYAVFPADGKNGARLDDDLEQFAARVVETEQITGKDQMAGRGDRQKFGQTFDNAKNQRLNERGKFHKKSTKDPENPAVPEKTAAGLKRIPPLL